MRRRLAHVHYDFADVLTLCERFERLWGVVKIKRLVNDGRDVWRKLQDVVYHRFQQGGVAQEAIERVTV